MTNFYRIVGKKTNQALEELVNFFENRKMQEISSERKSEKGYLFLHKMKRLINSKGKPTAVYLHDQRISTERDLHGLLLCCKKELHSLDLVVIPKEENARRFFEAIMDDPYLTPKDMENRVEVKPLLKLYALEEEALKPVEVGRVFGLSGKNRAEYGLSYSKTISLIERIREIIKTR